MLPLAPGFAAAGAAWAGAVVGFAAAAGASVGLAAAAGAGALVAGAAAGFWAASVGLAGATAASGLAGAGACGAQAASRPVPLTRPPKTASRVKKRRRVSTSPLADSTSVRERRCSIVLPSVATRALIQKRPRATRER